MQPPVDIRTLVEGLTADQPTRPAIQAGVDSAYRLARAYLRTARNHTIIAHVIVCKPDRDLPLDLIADLFETDHLGRFIRIRDYFAAADIDNSVESVGRAWRRLVLGTVSDSMFARFKDADGSLSKIVRNLKRVIGTLDGDLTLVRQCGRLHVQLATSGADREHNPPMLPEQIEPYIRHGLRDGFELAAVLKEVQRMLTVESEFAPRIELTALALLLRATTVRLHGPQASEKHTYDPDLSATIRAAVQRTERARFAFYVERERLTESEFTTLCQAVEVRMLAHAELAHTHVTSNADALRVLMPELTDEQYRQRYRNIFEYLYLLVREELEISLHKSATMPAGKDKQ